MKLGILSDTHNNITNILLAVEIFRQNGVETIIHCGDLTDPDSIWLFADFRLIFVFGNMDFSSATITMNIQSLNLDNVAVNIFQGQVDGKSIAVVHGHVPGYIYDLARKGTFDYVFHGHTHVQRHEKIGTTTVINPGPLGGKNAQSASVCIIDLSTDQVVFINIS